MPLLILKAEEVRALLPMAACVDVMEHAMYAVSAGKVEMPGRQVTPLEGGGHLFVMPGALVAKKAFGTKILSELPGNPAAGRPAVQGFVALFDAVTGTPAALVDGSAITRQRTAAASALATRVLARGDAASHGILGAGLQAGAHLEAVSCVRAIREIRVWTRDTDQAKQFTEAHCDTVEAELIPVEHAIDAAACDIVSAVTGASTPVLKGSWLRPGCHVNLVGAHRPDHREIDSPGMAGAVLFVDSREAALKEAGDLLMPVAEGLVSTDHIRGEIGEVLSGIKKGRTSEEQVTAYKSLGLAAQDLYAAAYVVEAARAAGVGRTVEFP
jgi:ornithine cyclodeaminase